MSIAVLVGTAAFVSVPGAVAGGFVRAHRRCRCERSLDRDQPQPNWPAQRCGPRWSPGCRGAVRRLRPHLPIHRRPSCDPRPLLPRGSCALPLLARTGVQLLAPRSRRDEASCPACQTAAPSSSAHHTYRRSLPVPTPALRRRKHLRRPRTRARTARTGAFVDAAQRNRAHRNLAWSGGCLPTTSTLPDSDRCLHANSPVPAPARPVVLPVRRSPQRLGLPHRSNPARLQLTRRSGDIPERWPRRRFGSPERPANCRGIGEKP